MRFWTTNLQHVRALNLLIQLNSVKNDVYMSFIVDSFNLQIFIWCISNLIYVQYTIEDINAEDWSIKIHEEMLLIRI